MMRQLSLAEGAIRGWDKRNYLLFSIVVSLG